MFIMNMNKNAFFAARQTKSGKIVIRSVFGKKTDIKIDFNFYIKEVCCKEYSTKFNVLISPNWNPASLTRDQKMTHQTVAE